MPDSSPCDWTEDGRLGALLDLGDGRLLDPTGIRAAVAENATSLSALGVRSSQAVAISLDSPLEALVAILACWRLGACAAVLDPSLSPPERRNVVSLIRPAAVLGFADDNGPVEPRIFASSGLDAPALILLTSGTTGSPKAVVHSHRALLSRIALNHAHIGTDALARTLLTLPLYFGHGLIGNALTALFSGGTLVLPARGPALASVLGDMVDEHRISFFSSVPSLWPLVLRIGKKPAGGTLRRVHVGSAPLSAELWNKIAEWCGTEVVNCYGITETANWIGGKSSLNAPAASGEVGRPWGGSYAVRNGDARILSAGEGEILVRSPSLMLGYLDRPDLTDASLQGGWYLTGDTGVLDHEGSLTLSGRIKDEINRAGQKIQPADLDLVLAAHPDVEEACAFAIPDPVTGEAVAIAVVPKSGLSLERSALKEWCAERMRPNAIPERWFFVENLPRTPRGKISRTLVRDTVLGG